MSKYPSDLSEDQFKLIAPYLPKVKSKRPRKYLRIQILNGILYRVKTGVPWRYLPTQYPHWRLVFYYFKKWRPYLRYINHILNTKCNCNPNILILDSQSVEASGELSMSKKGYDGHKKRDGIKRFILSDTYGNVWFSWITPANTSECIGAEYITTLTKHKAFPRTVHTILADKGYESKKLKGIMSKVGIHFLAMKSEKRYKETKHTHGKKVNLEQISIHKYLNKQISSLRWIVERNFSWFNRFRILVRQYERTYESHLANMRLALISLALKRRD